MEFILESLSDPAVLMSLLTLTVLEIVLGIDNIVFISILTDKLPVEQQKRAQNIGLMLAMLGRVLLLLSLSWMMRLTEPLFSILDHGFSGRDLILLFGGLFLIYKSTHEIHNKLEGAEGEHKSGKAAATFSSVMVQILLLDLVFSLDSVITAVGIAEEVWVMITAIVIAILVMMFAMSSISKFINEHPTIKMLALSFLLLIGFTLMAEGFHFEIPKGYIYCAMAFSIFVEILNLRSKKKSKKGPLVLRETPELDQ